MVKTEAAEHKECFLFSVLKNSCSLIVIICSAVASFTGCVKYCTYKVHHWNKLHVIHKCNCLLRINLKKHRAVEKRL